MLHFYEKLKFLNGIKQKTLPYPTYSQVKLMAVFCIGFHFQCCEPLSASHLLHSETRGSTVGPSFLTAGPHAVCPLSVEVWEGGR